MDDIANSLSSSESDEELAPFDDNPLDDLLTQPKDLLRKVPPKSKFKEASSVTIQGKE
jgi:hypothetical protein